MQSKLKTYNDLELVEVIRTKPSESEEAFKIIYDRYSGFVHSYALKLLGDRDTAEDVFQDTFIKFYKNVRYDDGANIKSYLIRIARNLCYNSIRNKKQNIPIEDMEYILQVNINYEKKELLSLINSAMELLDDPYKEIFILREYSNMNYNEIGEIMNITSENAKIRYFRAKQKIKEILKPYLEEIKSI